MEGRVGEDFVELLMLEIGFADEFGGVEDCEGLAMGEKMDRL